MSEGQARPTVRPAGLLEWHAHDVLKGGIHVEEGMDLRRRSR